MRNPNAITKQNILAFFRRQRTKEQGYYRFGCISKQEVQSPRHVERFDMIFGNLVQKQKITVLDNNKYQAVHDRNTQPRIDDAEAEV